MTAFIGQPTSLPAFPMTRMEAKAQGLEVYHSRYGCRRTGHGNQRKTSNNKCLACLQTVKNLKDSLRAQAFKQLKEQARREVLKELKAEAKKAEREQLDAERQKAREERARERAKAKAAATRAAKKAAKAQQQGPEVVPPWD